MPRIALMLDLEWSYKRHTHIFSGTQQYAQEKGWESIIDEFVCDTLQRSGTKSPCYDGVIARAGKPLAELAARLHVPVVNVWLSSPARALLPGVFNDHAAVARLRAEHLLSRGFRNFAALISHRDRGHETELAEFRRVLGEAGFQCIFAKVPPSPTKSLANWRKTEQVIAEWMEAWRPPIGVYVGTDEDGRFVAQMCRGRGWRVPEDVAIIAGYNEETICIHPSPSLTSIELSHEQIGYQAARMLDRLMANKKKNGKNSKSFEVEQILLPPKALIVRESTDFFAVDDELMAQALAFIAKQSHKPIGPNDVARAVATEKRTLERRFRKHLNRPIAAEIRRVRTERAQRELAQTDRTFYSIARDAGFGSPAQMYRIFCRDLGISPSEYRRQRRMPMEQSAT